MTLSGAIVPNAFAERSLEERGVVDVYWECRDCSLTIKNLDLDYPTDLKQDGFAVWLVYGKDDDFRGNDLYFNCNCDNPLPNTLSPGETVTVPLFAIELSTTPENWKKLQPWINGAKRPSLNIYWEYGKEDYFGPSFGEIPN